MLISEKKSLLSAYTNTVTILVCIGLFLAYTYLIVTLDNEANSLNHLYLLMLLQLTPAIILFIRAQFNFIAFVLLNHFMVYSVAKYNQIVNLDKLTRISSYTIAATSEMIYCTGLIIISYFAVRFFVCRKKYDRDQFELFQLTPAQYRWMGLLVISQPFLAKILPESFYTLNIVVCGAATILVLCSECGQKLTERYTKLAIILSAYYSFLESGSMSVLGSVGMIFVIVSLMQWKIKDFLLLIILGLTGVCIQTVKLEYRLATKLNRDYSKLEQVGILANLLAWRFTEGETPIFLMDEDGEFPQQNEETKENDVSKNLAQGFSRVGDDSLEKVLAMTPSQVPYWDGETYAHIPYMFIPRFLWPGKPKRDIWNKFGRVYGFLSENDENTSVGVNFLGEAYMNFGYTGLYSIACIFGMLIAIMESLSFYFLGKYSYFSFICFMIPFMNYGLDFGSILNGIIILTGVLMLVRYRLVGLLQRDVYSPQH
jgi:hypothetical protein